MTAVLERWSEKRPGTEHGGAKMAMDWRRAHVGGNCNHGGSQAGLRGVCSQPIEVVGEETGKEGYEISAIPAQIRQVISIRAETVLS